MLGMPKYWSMYLAFALLGLPSPFFHLPIIVCDNPVALAILYGVSCVLRSNSTALSISLSGMKVICL
nr:MAG TPA: hypothetical protein [Caudoviricetes sp.]